MKTVLTYGTFDLFHIGHVRLLERASQFGDQLIVGVSSDEFNAGKGKHSIMPYEHRAAIVGAIKCVSKVIPENAWDQKPRDIAEHDVDVFVMGDDWSGKFDDLKTLCDVQYLPRTSGISTTELKTALRPFRADKIAELQQGLSALETIIRQLDA